MLPPLKWSRPANVPYPNVWLRFKAKDLDSDALVEYRIQDVPEDQIEEAIDRLTEFYIPDEPICRLTGSNQDPEYIRDFQKSWRVHAAQRMWLGCYKEGSNEVIGVHPTYVVSKDDATTSEAKKQSQCKEFVMLIDLIQFMYKHGNFTVWDKYGVDKYLASFGLGVSRKYRGRGIGQRLLECRKYLAQAFGITVSHAAFASQYAAAGAELAGYHSDIELSWNEVYSFEKKFDFRRLESKVFSLKSLRC